MAPRSESTYTFCYKKTLRVQFINRHAQILVREVPEGGDQREPYGVGPPPWGRVTKYGAKRTPEGTDPRGSKGL